MSLSIYRGESTNKLIITIEDETDYSSYTCTAKVVKNLSDPTIVPVDTSVDAVNGIYVSISADNSANLPEGAYVLAILIEKVQSSVITLRKEIHETLSVQKSSFS